MDPADTRSPSSSQHEAARQSILINYTPPRRTKDRHWLHVLLFFVTLVACVFAGAELAGRYLEYGAPYTPGWFADGLRYAIPLLLFLTFHEFGHYFAARFHGVRTSLPYYVPFPIFFIPGFLHLGTFGAVIRIREPVPSTTKLFDIGVWGPIAGFVIALGVILYAVATLSPPTYLLTVPGHEELVEQWLRTGTLPREWDAPFTLHVGQTPLFWIISHFVPHMPPLYEIYHYPVLFAGWLGLLFTALNLLPVGQLDGGHILYSMVGAKWHGRIARGFVLMLLFSATLGYVNDVLPAAEATFSYGSLMAWFFLGGILYFFTRRIFRHDLTMSLGWSASLMIAAAALLVLYPAMSNFGYVAWFVWCLLIVLLIRVDHPPVLYHEPLTTGRYALGIAALIMFILCFSIRPIYFT